MVKHLLVAMFVAVGCSTWVTNAQAQYVGSSLQRAVATDEATIDEAGAANLPTADALTELLRNGPEQLASPKKLTGSLQIMLMLTVLSLAPAILLMTTSFVRIVVVLGLLRQALGTQQLPPSQVMTALSLFMTLLVMTPTWNEVYQQSIRPYSEGRITSPEEAFNLGALPIKRFMSRQIEMAGNSDDVWLFYDYLPAAQRSSQPPQSYDEVPLQALLPAFMLLASNSEYLPIMTIWLP